MRHFILFAISISLFSCHTKEKINIDFPEGGYPYPKTVEEKDRKFFSYPVKDSFSKKDSFLAAYFDPFFYKNFHETNLSLEPPKETVFRFILNGSSEYYAVLVMTQDEIYVKATKTGSAYPYPISYKDDSLTTLSQVEKLHFALLKNYPLTEIRKQYLDYNKPFIDSVVKIYPELLDPAYYHKLLDKVMIYVPEHFSYLKWSKSLSKKKFLYFLDRINNSEYWKLDPKAAGCTNDFVHSDSYILEAATPLKYQYVNFVYCNSLPALNSICEELMKYSGVTANREKWWKEQQKKRDKN